MALVVKDEGKVFEKPHTGMHDAVCTFVVDVGTHMRKTQFGEKKQHVVVFCWELEQLISEGEYAGKPFMVSKRYTFTLFEKGNLSKDLESWFAKKISDETRKAGFDLETLQGRKCTLNLVESEDGKYINVANVLPPNKDNAVIPVCTEKPKWINKMIEASLEKKGDTGDFGESLSDQFNQDLADPNIEKLPF